MLLHLKEVSYTLSLFLERRNSYELIRMTAVVDTISNDS